MTVYLVPGVFGAGGQIFDTNGKPANGALVNTYAAGTTSTVPVFTTNAGNVTASNPVVCNSDGRLPYELWQTQGQAIKILLTDSLANTLGTYDNLYGIGDPSAANSVSGYFKLTSIAGTANAITAVGPANLASLSAGQLFQFVPAASNTGATTLTITPSGGTSLGAKNVFSFGAASQGNDLIINVPVIIEYDGVQFNVIGANTLTISKPVLYTYVSGAGITLSGTSINEYKASSVSSAGTVDLGAIQGNTVDMTGSSLVTSFGVVQAGTVRTIRFSGTPVLNYSVSSLILPGNQNITTATGDVIKVISLGAGNWFTEGYQRADGTAVSSTGVVSGLVKLTSGTTSAATAVDVVMTSYTSYRNKYLVLTGMPVSGNVDILLRVSNSGGTSYDSGGGDYTTVGLAAADVLQLNSTVSGASPSVGNGASEGFDVGITMWNTTSSTHRPRFSWAGAGISAAGVNVPMENSGQRGAGQQTNAVRILGSAGGTLTINWDLYGFN